MTEIGNRESLSTDILVVGAGPAGLSAAIRAKQKAPHLSVTVVEKAAEIGGHVLSGAMIDKKGLDALLPDWRKMGAPLGPDVTRDRFHFLTPKGDFEFPPFLIPPLMHTKDGVITSLGDLCRWLGEQATALGVEIYPMTAAVDVVTSADGAVQGIITGDLGLDRHGNPKPGHAAGIALLAKYTLIAEGARGSLAKMINRQFGLREGKGPQKFALGIKEVWEISPDRHEPGRTDHYLGFPLDNGTGGGGFSYHAGNNRIYLGLVVHLDYKNPTLSPFDEFQRFKAHPAIARLLEGGKRISYGARALTSGGWQAIPEMAFPGGAVIGCSAGFVNVPRLKGVHLAMFSGMAAADAVVEAIGQGRAYDRLEKLTRAVLEGGIGAELRAVRNVKPLWSRLGTVAGVLMSGADLWCQSLFKVSPFGTLAHRHEDFETTRPKNQVTPKTYPRPDGKTGFDRSASVFLANIAHDEDQPVHLRLADPSIPIQRNLPVYGEPAPLYCPAGVYEVVSEGGNPVFRINAANCVHCKTCDIKDPAQNITWVPPEGGSGPNYISM